MILRNYAALVIVGPMCPGFTTYCNRRDDLLRSALATLDCLDHCRKAREAVGENGSKQRKGKTRNTVGVVCYNRAGRALPVVHGKWCTGVLYTQAPPTRPGDVAGVFTDEPGGVGK